MKNIYKHLLILESIADWEVSPRISNALRRHNIFTFEEYLSLSYSEICNIKNLGRKSRKELFEYIRKFYPDYMKGLK